MAMTPDVTKISFTRYLNCGGRGDGEIELNVYKAQISKDAQIEIKLPHVGKDTIIQALRTVITNIEADRWNYPKPCKEDWTAWLDKNHDK